MTLAAVLLGLAALLSAVSGRLAVAGILVAAAVVVYWLGFTPVGTKGRRIPRSLLGKSGGIPGLYVPTGDDDPHVVTEQRRRERMEEIRRKNDERAGGQPAPERPQER